MSNAVTEKTGPTGIILRPSPDLQPAALFTPTPKAAQRVLEFFTAQINNDNTRKAYLNATGASPLGARRAASTSSSTCKPFHVAAFVKELQGEFAPPTVKQHLAALRMLFDWLVTGHVIDVNPAHAVRGPKYVVKKGKTPGAWRRRGARAARQHRDHPDCHSRPAAALRFPISLGLRDRALIGVMVYTFARVNAVLQMKVRDYFVQGRRGWVRLHEKGGKEHEVPCHHNLEQYLDEYIAAAGIAGDPDGPFFRTTGRQDRPLPARPCGSRTPIA